MIFPGCIDVVELRTLAYQAVPSYVVEECHPGSLSATWLPRSRAEPVGAASETGAARGCGVLDEAR
jgi:hypothetical protein